MTTHNDVNNPTNTVGKLHPEMKWCDVPADTTLHEILAAMGFPEDRKAIERALSQKTHARVNTKVLDNTKEDFENFMSPVIAIMLQRLERNGNEAAIAKLQSAREALPEYTLNQISQLSINEWLDILCTPEDAVLILKMSYCNIIEFLVGLSLELMSAAKDDDSHKTLLTSLNEHLGDNLSTPLFAHCGKAIKESEEAAAAAKNAARAERMQTIMDGAEKLGRSAGNVIETVSPFLRPAKEGISKFFSAAIQVGGSFCSGLKTPADNTEESAE